MTSVVFLITANGLWNRPIQCQRELTVDPKFCSCCILGRTSLVKTADWCGLKILGSAHLWSALLP